MRIVRTIVPLAVLFAAMGTVGQQLSATEAAAGEPPEDALPRVFLLDAEKLAQTRRRVAAGDRELAPAMAGLRRDAEEALRAGPFSVVNNKSVPPSGDRHDYMSVGPYWWPDPNKPDGKPYIRRDGQVNPERNEYDSVPKAKMLVAVDSLAAAYYLTGHEPYAAHAAKLLQTWFLDDATRMNPNLNFGQGIPGHCDGRGVGIIDTLGLPRLIDSVGMLAGSKAWAATDQEALQAWFAEYLQWVLQSKYGRDEGRAKNNHGTWYDVQVAAYALFVGEDRIAARVLGQVPAKRISTQIQPDGSQPHELARTKSFSYSLMNLQGMFDLAALGEHVGVDLWNYQSDDGRGIRNALDFLVPYVLGEEKWRYKQIKTLHPAGLVPILRRGAIVYQEPRYEQSAAKLSDKKAAAERWNLFYPKPRF